MVDKSRPIFKPRPSFIQRTKNRINWQIQTAIFMGIAVLVSQIPFAVEGKQNSDAFEKKREWIKKTSRDPDVGSYTKIDVEEPPKPIHVDPNLARFREEFAKLRQKVDSDYRHNE